MAVTPALPERNRIITANRDDYGEIYPQLTFLDPQAAVMAERRRAELLAALGSQLQSACGGTKLYTRQLAPGCVRCIEGRWSCLFINGRCNLNCFYCPGRQNETGLPTTNTIDFHSPADYVSYLDQFDFRGMSLSGGEPLLTPGRTLAFLRAAKNKFGARLHTWLYTNGSLLTQDLLNKLRDAGLDEIRFDIGAVNYSLEKPLLAVGTIPDVTVEIPAVPEEVELLKAKLIEMADQGISFLNLHQLRLTAYNHPRLVGRPYTYLHGEKITVLESELAALEIIRHSIEKNIRLPVNYCSFVYKHRYQKAAARIRGSGYMIKPCEATTAAGYVRALTLNGEPEQLGRIAEHLSRQQLPPESWVLNAAGRQLSFAAELWQQIDFTDLTLAISYAITPVLAAVSYRNPFRQLQLPSGRKMVVERNRVAGFELRGSDIVKYFQWITQASDGQARLPDQPLRDILSYEQLRTGLQDYF